MLLAIDSRRDAHRADAIGKRFVLLGGLVRIHQSQKPLAHWIGSIVAAHPGFAGDDFVLHDFEGAGRGIGRIDVTIVIHIGEIIDGLLHLI